MPFAREKLGLALSFRVLPTVSAINLGAGGSFSYQNSLGAQCRKFGRLRNGPPQMVFDNKYFGVRVREQLQLFKGRQFVVERNKHATAVANRIRRNQPL